jgi:glycosyltransferase involved in cell wall biosynthesis
LNILNIIQCTNLGGMERANLARLAGLQRLGHNCELISLNPLGALAPLLERYRIPARGMPYRGTGGWRSFAAMYGSFRNSQPEAIIMTGHNLVASVALGNLCRDRRLLAIHFHHRGVKPASHWRLIYRLAYRQFRAITFPSDFIRHEAESLYPPLAEIAHTMRDPIDIPSLPDEEARRAARFALAISEGVPVIGNAGWLIPRKRFDIFLQTAARIRDSFPDTVFLIAGDGPERHRLVALADSLRLKANIRWLGWQEDLTQFYLALSVLLFNSEWDALGRTPLEAIGLGIPIVASVVHGGLDEVLGREDYGFITANHDVDWLAGKVAFFLRNSAAARAAAMAGRDHLMCVSDPLSHARRIEALLVLK